VVGCEGEDGSFARLLVNHEVEALGEKCAQHQQFFVGRGQLDVGRVNLARCGFGRRLRGQAEELLSGPFGTTFQLPDVDFVGFGDEVLQREVCCDDAAARVGEHADDALLLGRRLDGRDLEFGRGLRGCDGCGNEDQSSDGHGSCGSQDMT
jgi:hypothetical protein